MDIVVCTPDTSERAVLTTVVQHVGARAIFASAEAIIEHWADYAADAVLLVLHDGDATDLIHRRSVATVPMIVITDSVGEAQQAALYDAGASLVLPRPYSARLLMLQLRAMLQLSRGMLPNRANLQVDDLTLDLATCTARRADQVLPRLTTLECRLLHVLLLHRGQTLPAETLIERVWGYTGAGDRNMLRKLVNRLRAKIEPDPRQPRYIVTVPGAGYRFVPDARSES